ncbi:Flp pilus assembly protein CpaB [Leekyejoonella antrihumi]|uniref:Flp pilus assembly protein RcpC/CpaB domain-containing protein n=1 Tax=Leekyejoonella antrihumi TaxID=1660198 RepID=A0A563DTY4_9MICO|nr:RcpC/CpaB family pilus assembly protein [Leekyejoonella antrihumi]TWP33718.1 hypothetical protein FGL98_19960 [Leekyejoonella antrihumi]
MKKRIAAIVVAVVVALFGVGAVVSYAHSADNRAVAGQQVTKVYIAASTVPKGTTAQTAVDKGMIKLQSVVAAGAPSGAMAALDPAHAGLVALSAIQPGEMVMTAGFGVMPRAAADVSGVPNGQVALTVTLGIDSGVAPLLAKGSHIVIYDTFNARDPKAKQLAPAPHKLADDTNPTGIRGTAVVLSDVEVIAIGASTPTSGASKSSTASTSSNSNGAFIVTVAVTPAESVKLVQAIQTGNLYAGLLGSGTKVNQNSTANDTNVVKP